MQDIIPIFTSNFNGSQTQSIDARQLHEFLEVKTKFATWVQRKIQKHRFIENVDFVSVSQNRENGGKSIEYHFSIDMAKQISMLEDNEKKAVKLGLDLKDLLDFLNMSNLTYT